MTGWNLPPGCTNRMIEEQVADRPCDVCGRFPDDCICPECAVCGEVGSARCYEKVITMSYGEQMGVRACSATRGILVPPLVRSAAQIASLEAARAEWQKEAEIEEAKWKEWLAEEEHFRDE